MFFAVFFAKVFRLDDLALFADIFAAFLADLFSLFAFAFGGLIAGPRFAFRLFFAITTGTIGIGDIRGSANPSPAIGMKTTWPPPDFTGSGSIACFAAAVTEVAMFFNCLLYTSD